MMRTRLRFLAAFLLLPLAIAIGCHAGHHPQTASGSDSADSDDSQFKVYPLRGTIVATDPATGEVTISHEAIPGYMDAMTMPYKLRDTRIIGELHPGDKVTADLMISQIPDGGVFVDHFVVIGQAKPDYKPTVLFHVPQPGDIVPDFRLTNQDGRLVHLHQFRGKALLLTFIYTRCPLPDFCPRVTRNFAALEKSLSQDQALYAKTHLLCASFDPQHDTPARLKSYGEEYIGSSDSHGFAHWDFAVPTARNLPSLAHYFDVGITDEADETITHTLSTTLIGPDGKVVQFYPGNDWTAQQLLADLKRLYPGL